MLKQTVYAIKERLKSYYKQIEFYEGQFDRFDEEIINPPALYIHFTSADPSETHEAMGTMYFTLYIMASKLERDPSNMMDILENTILELSNKGLRGTANEYLGKCYFVRVEDYVNYPGMLICAANFSVSKS